MSAQEGEGESNKITFETENIKSIPVFISINEHELMRYFDKCLDIGSRKSIMISSIGIGVSSLIGFISLIATYKQSVLWGIGVGIVGLIFLTSIICFFVGLYFSITYRKITPESLLADIREKSQKADY